MLRERERETQNSEQCINKIYARQQITSSKIIQIRTAYFDLETASKIVHVVCLFNQTKDDREKKSVWRKAWQIFIHGFALCPEAFVSLLSFIYSHAGFVCVCVKHRDILSSCRGTFLCCASLIWRQPQLSVNKFQMSEFKRARLNNHLLSGWLRVSLYFAVKCECKGSVRHCDI